ncbi:MAG: family 78 glycoside hydrolase catalytic domain [Verrucomicrobiota bacterium]
MTRQTMHGVWRTMLVAGAFLTGDAVAQDSAKPPVNGQTVFTLKTTPVAPKAIVSSQAVADAVILLDGKPVLFQPGSGAAEVVLDFGREIVGTVRFGVRAEAPSKLEVRYGEALQEVHRDNDYAARWYKRPIDHLEVKAGPQELRNYGRRAFRYLRLIVPAGAAPITLESVQATLQHYPVNEVGTFSCSDPQLNKIWELAAYSTKLCMQQYYEDGIKRDGLLWISDYRVQYLCNALVYGDRDLARKSLFLMAASQNPDGSMPAQASRAGASQHPSNINYMPGIPRGVNNWILVNYCLDYIGCLRDYYRFTGDKDALTQLWPAVQKLLPFLMKQEPANLKPLGNFITDGRYGEAWWGSHGVLEMQFAIAMQDASYLAQVMNDDALRRQCDDYLPRQRERIMNTYFDKDEQFFLDEAGKKLSTSWHVNSFSVLAGLGDYAKQAQQLDKTSSQVRPATAGFMLYWTMEAKFRAGMTEAALNDIRKIYGHMLSFGATTTWEKCDLTVGDHPNETDAAGSRCHGWSAGPAYLLPAHVLGVQPAEPGFASVVVEPKLGDLQWAEGVVPTPKGLIHLRWERGSALTGSVTLPAGMTGEVKLPGRKIPLKPGENRIKAD